jgi:hypothetical protein
LKAPRTRLAARLPFAAPFAFAAPLAFAMTFVFAVAFVFAAHLVAPRAARAEVRMVVSPEPPTTRQARPAPTPRSPAAQAPAPKTQGATPAPTPTPTPTPKTRGAAPAPTPKPARPAASPLAGRVVGDAGEPIAGVTVYASSRAPGGNTRPQNVATDDEGNFIFPALEPGLYYVNASVPGYVAEVDPQTGRSVNTYRPGEQAHVRLVKGGIITGSVNDQQGEPLVGISVRALRVRDLEGRTPPPGAPSSAEDRTDDRGVYRIYGLVPGMYVVFTGGLSSNAFGPVTAYGGDVPTFYPSGTRDTTAEVAVRGGQESAGIDIRYRDEQGHRVTGTVEFPAGAVSEFGVGVTLAYAATGMPAGGTGVGGGSPDRSFSVEGVPDGDFELVAQGGGRDGLTVSSAPQRVSVRGGDVTGLRLTLVPLASASGTLSVEPASEADRARESCKAVRSSQLPQETLVTATPERARGTAPRPFSRLDAPRETTPDAAGDFLLRSLEPARYRLSFRLFDESLYVRSVQLPGATPNATPASAAARETFELKSGQQLTGIGVRLAEGAASFGGRVVLAEGATPQTPAPTRVYLVPQERERADDPLRFYEAAAAPDGAFSFRNLAPGRYLLLARAEADAPDAPRRPAAWDADARTRLRREAEAAAAAVELQPCQRTPDFTLRFPQMK